MEYEYSTENDLLSQIIVNENLQISQETISSEDSQSLSELSNKSENTNVSSNTSVPSNLDPNLRNSSNIQDETISDKPVLGSTEESPPTQYEIEDMVTDSPVGNRNTNVLDQSNNQNPPPSSLKVGSNNDQQTPPEQTKDNNPNPWKTNSWETITTKNWARDNVTPVHKSNTQPKLLNMQATFYRINRSHGNTINICNLFKKLLQGFAECPNYEFTAPPRKILRP